MMNVAEVMPASCPSCVSSISTVEVLLLGPTREHAQQHRGPVLRVGATGARVHFADRVALVVLAAEQRAELEPVEGAPEIVELRRDLGLDRLVVFLAPELEQRLHVGDAAVEVVDQLDVVAHRGELAAHLARLVGIVPEIGRRRLGLERRQAAAGFVDPEVVMRVARRDARPQPGPR